MADIDIYNELDIVPSSKTLCMVDGRLYKIHKKNAATGLVILIDQHNKKPYTMLLDDFLRNKEPVYPLPKVADLLNRHKVWLKRQIWYGVFFSPTYCTEDGNPDKTKRGAGTNGYYSEKEVFALRDIMVEKRQYSKLGDKHHTASIPSVQELRRRMGIDMLTYTKLPDGRFIPVWRETT